MTLAEFLKHSKMSQRDFANRISVHESAISNYLAGKRKPNLQKAVAIQTYTRGLVTCEELLHPGISGNHPT